MTDYKSFYECEQKRADKAEDALAAEQVRIAELEARLKWHATTPPKEPGQYIVLGQFYGEVEFVTVADYDGTEWYSIRTELPVDYTIHGWRPLY